MQLPKAYQPKDHEDRIYQDWEKSGLFSPKIEKVAPTSRRGINGLASPRLGLKGKKPFVIMMPPPNATGTLHLGHAVMLALQDIMTRYHRMKGEPSLWLPGTDHASIATQNKVEKLIAEEGLTRHKLGRSEFLKRVEEFVKGSQNTIRNQVRKMGSSCDWTRERYTLEPVLSRAVREIFVNMYNDGLIYRGNRIVNWCPRCSSTLADDEVDYKEEKTKFYYLKYGPFTISTARPETKFLDKIIVVHPKDKRYQKYIGKEMVVPWIEGDVKATILADESVDMKFGTGAMTITPAHDFNDFEISQRHKLDVIQIIDEKGNLNENAGVFAGQNARKARDGIIAKLQEKGLVEKIDENYVHNISLCYRCSTPIEPLVSKQWFISVDKKFGKAKKSLKQMSTEVVKKGKIKILPERFEKTYFHWMNNLHDWCISRQIWFGHQIPVWYCMRESRIKNQESRCEKPIVSIQEVKNCPYCQGPVQQDPDTLDTWFSSGLWTFSTLGWPEKTKDLEYFHPTSVLETGYDILFFWVARMILMTSYALNEIPFKHVYLHGLVRTREGKKMSKSDPKTCIDPLDMIEKYGADALRLSMVIGGSPGNDVRLYEEKIAGFRNFVNKIWNAARFALMQTEEGEKIPENIPIEAKTLADKWILTRTQELIRDVTADIDRFQFSEAGNKIYDFTWNEYCAWYLEISKGNQKNLGVLMYVLETILALLHPFVPYVTEVLWSHLHEVAPSGRIKPVASPRLGLGEKSNLLMGHAWPKVEKKLIFDKEASQMSVVVEVITAIRNLRQEAGIDAGKKIHAVLASKKWLDLLEEKREPIMRLARIEKLDIVAVSTKIKPALSHYTQGGVEIILPIGDLVDVSAERKRLTEEKENLEKYLKSLESKLGNDNFVKRAPKEIVAAEQEKLASSKEKLAKILQRLQNI